jgi:hypothetical protein
MKFSSAVLIALVIALTAVSPRVARASRVVITAPDPTCPAENEITNDTVTVSGTGDSLSMFVNCTGGTLDTLTVDLTPTLPNDNVFVTLLGGAFDASSVSTASTPPPPGLTIINLFCLNPGGDCTGLANDAGVGVLVSTPEPSEAALLLLGIGVSFIGLGRRRHLKAIESN